MAISAMTDIVCDLNPRLHRYNVNGSTIAGATVYVSENGGVTMTSNGSQAFKGVALQNIADNGLVTVAVPPTTVYLTMGLTTNISAGGIVMPYTTVGSVCNCTNGGMTEGVTIVGQVEDFYSSSIIKAQLMYVPNASV